jgi:hypothetical protein
MCIYGQALQRCTSKYVLLDWLNYLLYTGCIECIANCPLPVAYCLLPVAYCILPIACCPLQVVHCLLQVAYCILHSAYAIAPIAYCRVPYCLLRSPANIRLFQPLTAYIQCPPYDLEPRQLTTTTANI